MLLRGRGCQCVVMLAEGETNFVAVCGIGHAVVTRVDGGDVCVCVCVHGVCVRGVCVRVGVHGVCVCVCV